MYNEWLQSCILATPSPAVTNTITTVDAVTVIDVVEGEDTVTIASPKSPTTDSVLEGMTSVLTS